LARNRPGQRDGTARTLAWASLLLLTFGVAAAARADERARKLVALIDYIGGDYKNAVESGRVIDRLEYDEMLEFAKRSIEIFDQLKVSEGGRDPAGIEKDLRTLALHVRRKSGDQEVPALARKIKERLIARYGIATHPRALPDLAKGREIYDQNCSQCHGAAGGGDGPSAATIEPKDPKPANFLDPERMSGLSPFKAFNATTFGIEGTAMPGFSALPEEERWQAAFYLFSLRFSPRESAAGKALFSRQGLAARWTDPALLSASTDGELREKLIVLFPIERDAEAALAYLRRGLLEESRTERLLTAHAHLNEALDLYRAGQRQQAYQRAVDAYLDGFELAEPAVFARDASLGRELETLFAEFRSAIRRGDDFARLEELYRRLDAGLNRASDLLRSGEPPSGGYTLFNAALIIVREGVEAALIVSAILAVLKATGAFRAARYVHLGWSLAVVSGISTWVLAQTAVSLTGAQREILEGFTAIFAAVVLFSVSFWLISKAEARRWQQYIHRKVHEALSSGRIASLVGVSFLAVYREAFETVLFYQALWLQSHATQNFVVGGFLVGAALLAVLVWLIFELGRKMPLRLFFGSSSVLLYLLAFVFAGQGLKDLQAAGWLSETPLPSLPEVPFLAIYPTVETLLAQAAMILALIGALLWLWIGRALQTYPRRP
jgi:high-affinity iron transporter